MALAPGLNPVPLIVTRMVGQLIRPVFGETDSILGVGVVVGWVVPAGVVPCGVVPAGVVPAGVVPAGVVPGGVVPAGVVPAGVVPGGVVRGGVGVAVGEGVALVAAWGTHTMPQDG